ncbi:hypothetical protein HK098_005867 [Nowakowskiella sp. JEL0407]|nr:hypothetical protein HK098_005867 [Nowakowskiella sp. JEL0407]
MPLLLASDKVFSQNIDPAIHITKRILNSASSPSLPSALALSKNLHSRGFCNPDLLSFLLNTIFPGNLSPHTPHFDSFTTLLSTFPEHVLSQSPSDPYQSSIPIFHLKFFTITPYSESFALGYISQILNTYFKMIASSPSGLPPLVSALTNETIPIIKNLMDQLQSNLADSALNISIMILNIIQSTPSLSARTELFTNFKSLVACFALDVKISLVERLVGLNKPSAKDENLTDSFARVGLQDDDDNKSSEFVDIYGSSEKLVVVGFTFLKSLLTPSLFAVPSSQEYSRVSTLLNQCLEVEYFSSLGVETLPALLNILEFLMLRKPTPDANIKPFVEKSRILKFVTLTELNLHKAKQDQKASDLESEDDERDDDNDDEHEHDEFGDEIEILLFTIYRIKSLF